MRNNDGEDLSLLRHIPDLSNVSSIFGSEGVPEPSFQIPTCSPKDDEDDLILLDNGGDFFRRANGEEYSLLNATPAPPRLRYQHLTPKTKAKTTYSYRDTDAPAPSTVLVDSPRKNLTFSPSEEKGEKKNKRKFLPSDDSTYSTPKRLATLKSDLGIFFSDMGRTEMEMEMGTRTMVRDETEVPHEDHARESPLSEHPPNSASEETAVKTTDGVVKDVQQEEPKLAETVATVVADTSDGSGMAGQLMMYSKELELVSSSSCSGSSPRNGTTKPPAEVRKQIQSDQDQEEDGKLPPNPKGMKIGQHEPVPEVRRPSRSSTTLKPTRRVPTFTIPKLSGSMVSKAARNTSSTDNTESNPPITSLSSKVKITSTTPSPSDITTPTIPTTSATPATTTSMSPSVSVSSPMDLISEPRLSEVPPESSPPSSSSVVWTRPSPPTSSYTNPIPVSTTTTTSVPTPTSSSVTVTNTNSLLDDDQTPPPQLHAPEVAANRNKEDSDYLTILTLGVEVSSSVKENTDPDTAEAKSKARAGKLCSLASQREAEGARSLEGDERTEPGKGKGKDKDKGKERRDGRQRRRQQPQPHTMVKVQALPANSAKRAVTKQKEMQNQKPLDRSEGRDKKNPPSALQPSSSREARTSGTGSRASSTHPSTSKDADEHEHEHQKNPSSVAHSSSLGAKLSRTGTAFASSTSPSISSTTTTQTIPISIATVTDLDTSPQSQGPSPAAGDGGHPTSTSGAGAISAADTDLSHHYPLGIERGERLLTVSQLELSPRGSSEPGSSSSTSHDVHLSSIAEAEGSQSSEAQGNGVSQSFTSSVRKKRGCPSGDGDGQSRKKLRTRLVVGHGPPPPRGVITRRVVSAPAPEQTSREKGRKEKNRVVGSGSETGAAGSHSEAVVKGSFKPEWDSTKSTTASMSGSGSSSVKTNTKPFEFSFRTDLRVAERQQRSTSAAATSTNSKLPSTFTSSVHPIPDFKSSHAQLDIALSARRSHLTPVVPLPMEMHTEIRAQQRTQFDLVLKEKEKQRKEMEEVRRKEEEEEEEREVREMRKRIDEVNKARARPVPEWYYQDGRRN